MLNVNHILRALFISFLFSSSALAASITVIPSGNPASFSIEGTGMDGVSGIQLDIAYDDASLSAPTVTQGGLVAGAMLVANTSRPGIIRIAIVSTRAFSGNGQIATIVFASKKGNGGITSVTSSMIDIKGSAIASSASSISSEATPGTTSNPGVPFSQPVQQPGSTTATTTTVSGTTPSPTYLGTVTLPAEQQKPDSQTAPSSSTPLASSEPAASVAAEQPQPASTPTAEAKPAETPQYIIYKSVLDRFKQYSGSKNLTAMVTLFNKQVAQNIHQEPAILVSDGQNKAIIDIDVPARATSAPNFAVKGGSILSFKQDSQIKGRWRVEVLPAVDTVTVSVTIITGAEEFEFPLTVVPLIKPAQLFNEQGWTKFLKDTGTVSAPLHDFNADGVRDYVDEYIFVAYYLLNKQASTKPASTLTTPKKR